jgi:predicted transcriptional regulator
VVEQIKRLTIAVESLEDFRARSLAQAKSGVFAGSRHSFVSHALLWKALSPKRLDLLRAMAGQAPISIREAARRVGRDVKAVHHDVHALLENGFLRKTDDGRIEFPYDEIHLDVVLKPLDASAA